MMRWRNFGEGYTGQIATLAKKAPRELLGVAANADRLEIKAAYIRMVKAYHPDTADPFMAKHNQEVLKLINAAYEKLKDEQ